MLGVKTMTGKRKKISGNIKMLFRPGFEPGTFRVLSERDNHYTTETEIQQQPDARVTTRKGVYLR